jgi:3-methyladenine DNA glycosylase/8-oxoguanine DNA glycosylase
MNAKALRELSLKDRKLAAVIEKAGPIKLQPTLRRPYEALVQAVVYQQLNGTAAATILGRVKALFGGKRFPSPGELIAMPDERLRGAGLSGAKTRAVKDIAAKTLDGTVPTLGAAAKLSDDELIERLSTIRGVGRWTVEMLLIFNLGRTDVLPAEDYGVRKGFALAYQRSELPSPRDLRAYGERWKPHRTTAAWYMWRAVEVYGKK